MNGNVAVDHLTAQSNFGTGIRENLLDNDIHYIGQTDFLQSSSFVSAQGKRKNTVIFGKDVALTTVDNGHKIAANNNKLDHVNADEIIQEKDTKYINFDSEFASLQKTSTTLATHPQTEGVKKDFSDENNRYVDVSAAASERDTLGSVTLTSTNEKKELLDGAVYDLYKEGENAPLKSGLTTVQGQIHVTNLPVGKYYFVETKSVAGCVPNTEHHEFSITPEQVKAGSSTIYVTLTRDEIERDRPITITGLEKNGTNVVVNVDTAGASDVNVGAEIKLHYTDGTDRPNKETEDFSDAVLLWNFANRAAGQTLNINRARFQGSLLAVGDTVNVGQNVDGSIIADTVNVNGGETHRWDYHEHDTPVHPVEVYAVDSLVSRETISISVRKEWVGAAGQSARVHLYADGAEVASAELNSSTSWQHIFADLDKYTTENELIHYTVREDAMDGYIPAVTGDAESGFTVINTQDTPVKPVEPEDPEDPEPGEPEEPTKPGEPEEPTKPEEPENPDPTEPNVPEDPQPEDPQPVTPKHEVPKPVEPSDPDKPKEDDPKNEEPKDPEPETPAQPEDPTPFEPSSPDKPKGEDPTPEVPSPPAPPVPPTDRSVEPKNPETPEPSDPTDPEDPQSSEEPSGPKKSEKAENPAPVTTGKKTTEEPKQLARTGSDIRTASMAALCAVALGMMCMRIRTQRHSGECRGLHRQ
ncbi:Cna B-type domain-containing protein [Alloscardovia macacae]|uniref:Cna B-type domain-containing protein n=1 Tax=Alloscardovia macacae TaxID=1160091 RepID=UPI001313FF66|nr:Cna B-type domain-containing protein [Alloscardovia macacae]